MDLKLHQVGFADMLVLNTIDLAGQEQVEKVRDWLDDHFNAPRIVETDYCEAPYESPLGCRALRHRPGQTRPSVRVITAALTRPAIATTQRSTHTSAFSRWSYETDEPVGLEAPRKTIRRLPGACIAPRA
jgi:G3E family GTPase